MSDSSGTGQITQQMEKLDLSDATQQQATVASRHEKPALAWNLDSNSFVPGSSRALSPGPQSDQALPLEKNTKPQSPGLPSQPPPPPHHMFYGASPFYGPQYVQPHPDEFSVNRPVSPGLTAIPRGPYKTPLVNNVDIRKRDQKSPIKGMHHGYTHYYQQNNKRPPPQPYANNYYGSSRSRTHPQIQTQHHTQTGQQPGHYSYAPSALPHNVHISPGRRSVHSFFMSESLRQDLHHRTSLILKGSDPDDPATKLLPERVGGYHSFYPLEDSPSNNSISRTFSGFPTFVYKCMHIRDGLPYVMRKVDSGMRTNEYGMQIVEMWKQIQHPGVVTLRELFRSTLFDPGHTVSSLFFVYDYHPGAQTLEEKFFNTSTLSYFQEEVIWGFIVQLCSAIECIHSHNQACRQTLTPSKVLVTGKNRLRINCVGIEDVLQLEPNRNVTQLQYHDMHYLGQLIVSLACKSTDAMSNFAKSMEHISNTYSQDLKDLIVTLCNNKRNAAYPTISDICQVINSRILDQVDRLYCYNDILEGELAKEVENGRLFRLVCKLGFVNERPENNVSAAWSETGDRYLAKLFRDYVFHQVQEDGTPVIDFAHVVECLNKLDVGTDEKLLLMSRDEKSMLVASYKDLKRILTDCFNQLVAKQAQSELAKQQGTMSPGGFGPYPTSPQPTVTPQQKQQLQHQQQLLQLQQLQLHQHQLQHYLSEHHHDFG